MRPTAANSRGAVLMIRLCKSARPVSCASIRANFRWMSSIACPHSSVGSDGNRKSNEQLTLRGDYKAEGVCFKVFCWKEESTGRKNTMISFLLDSNAKES
jgi:hypothetical protein